MSMKSFSEGIYNDNPIFKQMLGLCPTLAVTTSVINGIGMGIAVIVVLVCSNVAIASVRNVVPAKVRIPAYIVIIASFVTVVDLLMNAYTHDLHKVLGIFIPLIVVNCIVLGRAESFASKNTILNSALDGLGNGLGFTLALILIGSIREIIGSGSFLGIKLFSESVPQAIVFILPPGAFIVMGFLMAGYNSIRKNRAF